uniref:Uncharacterized protein n=1 Tax=Caenorhabditis tropicalis TaxID=1561998 RepID=A0A1I7V1L1_9PELO
MDKMNNPGKRGNEAMGTEALTDLVLEELSRKKARVEVPATESPEPPSSSSIGSPDPLKSPELPSLLTPISADFPNASQSPVAASSISTTLASPESSSDTIDAAIEAVVMSSRLQSILTEPAEKAAHTPEFPFQLEEDLSFLLPTLHCSDKQFLALQRHRLNLRREIKRKEPLVYRTQEFADLFSKAVEHHAKSEIYKDYKIKSLPNLFDPKIIAIPQGVEISSSVGKYLYQDWHNNSFDRLGIMRFDNSHDAWLKIRNERGEEYLEWMVRAAKIDLELLVQLKKGFLFDKKKPSSEANREHSS